LCGSLFKRAAATVSILVYTQVGDICNTGIRTIGIIRILQGFKFFTADIESYIYRCRRLKLWCNSNIPVEVKTMCSIFTNACIVDIYRSCDCSEIIAIGFDLCYREPVCIHYWYPFVVILIIYNDGLVCLATTGCAGCYFNRYFGEFVLGCRISSIRAGEV
jgi:hypothetical protein